MTNVHGIRHLFHVLAKAHHGLWPDELKKKVFFISHCILTDPFLIFIISIKQFWFKRWLNKLFFGQIAVRKITMYMYNKTYLSSNLVYTFVFSDAS
jgi:hypothetical protein